MQANRLSTLKKDLKTNRHVAMNAVIKDVVNAVAKHSSVRCTLYSAHSVEKKRKFRLNRKVTALFIAVTALMQDAINNRLIVNLS